MIQFTGHAAPTIADASNTIWVVFIIDVIAEFVIAPKQGLCRDAERPDAPVAGQASVDALRDDVAQMKEQLVRVLPPQ